MTDDVTTLSDMHGNDKSDYKHIGRNTRFGNPFKLKEDGGEYTREESVDTYIDHFRAKIKADEATQDSFKIAIEELRGEDLGCWCVPKLCHGHVILYYLDTGKVPNSVEDLYEWGAPHKTQVGGAEQQRRWF